MGEWQEILKDLKRKNMQPIILYPARMSFKIQGEIKKLHQQTKAKRLYQYQTHSKRNTERDSLNKKINKRKD